ncbi:unnamed protein product (macronuclear) [Paramecium tetraurelia]|uniref:VWFA domain-containing protein n=1 Tax=Paramecium tetraurelia TaxID=5888 RepID=A0BY84_PARTE|nr:uncharacterized protein GSPATT00033354001 [Paramecium tetraurelia]CAK63501.1 unnamed protein product [Paramecium tetraurelia]|eukprot:XP_001430899.1 hypothetical protein (macronuclear) [Paramecium tetraurelia strain d4-2]
MDGSRIQKAKQSLILFLKSLPQNSLFNIVSFGTMYISLWDESRKYTQNNLKEAILHVNSMKADMEGTNIYKPLQNKIYNSSYGRSKDTTLNVFLLTDGEDYADPIIELVKNNNRAETRIYTLGIGEGCSIYLIKRVAEVGNGKFHIVGDNEDINEKVIDLLEDSLTPYLQNFKLETNVKEVYSIIPNPESIVSLKKNQELTIQILFSNEQELENIEFSMHCYNPQDKQPIKYSVNLNLNQSQDNEYFHKLAAHKFITYYDNAIKYGEQQVNFIKLNKQFLKDEDIVSLSIENQILSNKTAFVCEVCVLEDQFKQQDRSKVKIIKIHPVVNRYTEETQQQRMSLNNPPLYCKKLPFQQQKLKSIQQFNQLKLPFLKQFVRKDQKQTPQLGLMGKNYQKQEPMLECFGNQMQTPYQTSAQRANISFPIELLGIQISQSINMSQSSLPQIALPKQNQKSLENQSNQQLLLISQDKNNDPTYENLMNFAQVDGRFKINKDIQMKVNYLNLSNQQGLKADVWNTLLILLYLENFCRQFKKSWQLIYLKGVQYLLQNGINYKQKKQELGYPYT